MPLEAGLARLSHEECMRLLAGASFGRVGVSVDALPAILPVTIAVLDDGIIFRTVAGTKLAYAARNAVLAVEVDEYDAVQGDGWSVLVRGIATPLEDPERIIRAGLVLEGSWIPEGAGEHYVQVSCDLVTGRRLQCRDGEAPIERRSS